VWPKASAQQALFGLIDTRRQVVVASTIRMEFLHHPSVGLDNIFPAGTGRQSKDI
jgi:hypothetical protein